VSGETKASGPLHAAKIAFCIWKRKTLMIYLLNRVVWMSSITAPVQGFCREFTGVAKCYPETCHWISDSTTRITLFTLWLRWNKNSTLPSHRSRSCSFRRILVWLTSASN